MADVARLASLDADFKAMGAPKKVSVPVSVPVGAAGADRFAGMDADFKAMGKPAAAAAAASAPAQPVGFGKGLMTGLGELAVGGATALRDLVSSKASPYLDEARNEDVRGKFTEKTQPWYSDITGKAAIAHQKAQQGGLPAKIGEGIGYYGPMAAIPGGPVVAGGLSSVAGNVLDPTKTSQERYGLADNAVQGTIGAVGGHYGAKLFEAAPKIAKGVWNSVMSLPKDMETKGLMGSITGRLKEAGSNVASAVLEDVTGKTRVISEAGSKLKNIKLTPAQRVVAKTAEAGGFDREAANTLAKDAREYGINMPLIGILDDPNLTRYAQAVGSFSGGAKKAQELVKDIKSRQVPKAIEKAIDGIGKQKGITPLQSGTALTSLVNDVYQAKKQQLSTAAKPFFSELRKEAFPDSTYEMLIESPIVKEAVDLALKTNPHGSEGFREGLESLVKMPSNEIPEDLTAAQYQDFIHARGMFDRTPSYNNLAIMNEAKKALGHLYQAAKRSDSPLMVAKQGDYAAASSRIGKFLKEHSENYRKAIELYDEDSLGGEVRQLQDSIYKTLRELHSDRADKAMAKVFTYPPEVIKNLRQMLVSGGQGGKDVWDNAMAGFMTEVFDNVRKTNPFGFTKELFGDPKVQSQLKAALPDRYDSLKKFFGIIEKTQETLQKLPTSMTAPLQQAQAELGREMGTTVLDLATSRKGWIDTAMDVVRNAYIKNMVQNSKGSEELAVYLLSDEGLTMLNKIKDAPPEYAPAVATTLLEKIGSVSTPAYLKHLWNSNMEAQ